MQKPPVFIECGSANSFELSPRFANMGIRGSRVSEKFFGQLKAKVIMMLCYHSQSVVWLILRISSLMPRRSMCPLMWRVSFGRPCLTRCRRRRRVSTPALAACSSGHKHCTISLLFPCFVYSNHVIMLYCLTMPSLHCHFMLFN